MKTEKKIRLVVIEPSPIIRQGMQTLLERYAHELTVSETYPDYQAFQERKHDAMFDVILINPTLISSYKSLNIRTIISGYPDVALVAILYEYVDSETLNSFNGILDIYDDAEKIIRKLKNIVHDFTPLQNTSHGDNVDLSDREKEILIAVAKGMTNKEIADKHFISVHTVVSHRKNITRKTGIKTVSGLTIYAIFNNLISQEECS